MRWMRAGVLVGVLCAVAACQNTALRTLDKPGEGPDEFRIVPAKPLKTPDSLSALPAPTPGGSNLTDQNPLQDSVLALGGRRSGDSAGPIPGADAGIVNQASRFGRDGSIRSTLATEDEAFRKKRGRLTQIRIAKVDRYNDVYRREALDPFREINRWRKAGARTPTSPPQ